MQTITFDPATHAIVPREPTLEMVMATFGQRCSPLSVRKFTQHRISLLRKAIAAAPPITTGAPL